MRLKRKIESKEATLGIIGLGYVGLPLAVEFARAGFHVIGFDIDADKVAQLAHGESYIADVPNQRLRAVRDRLVATTDFDRLAEVDSVNICVPTPLRKTRDPDVSYIVAAVEEIKKRLHRDELVILESTTYPGTTDELILPMLQATGLKVGKDFFLAFSPERVDPGNVRFNTANIPKVVGGVTARCTDLATLLYASTLHKVVPVSSTRVAEMVKLLENTFRSVNIGLVNELALMCNTMNIDVWEVIDAAATKPFGFMPFYPGPGLGGHCQDGDEFVFVRRDGGFDAVRMKELARRRKSRKIGDVEVLPLDDIDVLSFDLGEQRTCYRRATHLFRRWYPNRVTLRSHEGRTLTVTDGHPMIVQNGHGLETRRADGMDSESRLVVAVDLPAGEPAGSIDLVEALNLERKSQSPIRVTPRSGRWIDHWDSIRSAARRAGIEKKDLRRANTLPLKVFLQLEREGRAPFPRQVLQLATGRGRGHATVPLHIPVGPDLARMIGYYLSEGCLTRDKSWRIRWTFGAHERELITDLTGTLERLGFRWSIHRVKRWKAVQIKVSSNLLGRLLAKTLGCGKRSEEMRIPPLLLGAAPEVRRSLLGALLNGDGSVDSRTGLRPYRKRGREYVHQCNSACVSYFTSSPRLLQQVTLLLHSLDFVPTVQRRKPELRLFGEDQLRRLAPLMMGGKRDKLETYLRNRSKPMASRTIQRHEGFATVAPDEVQARGGGWVYSLEVPGTQTYVTSFGLVSHNCIPIDPFYLSWKAKLDGFEARFIELAGQVNSSMPHYVVTKTMEALNDRRKSLKGARILLLGVAYKADIDDTRESPAIDIYRLLASRGALVSFADPHVNELHLAHGGENLAGTRLSARLLKETDCTIILTAHKAFNYRFVVRNSKLILDTRNALKGFRDDHIVRL